MPRSTAPSSPGSTTAPQDHVLAAPSPPGPRPGPENRGRGVETEAHGEHFPRDIRCPLPARATCAPPAAWRPVPGLAANLGPGRLLARPGQNAGIVPAVPTATCTSATPSHPPQFRPGPNGSAAAATCASTTPTRKRKSRYVDSIIDAVMAGCFWGIRGRNQPLLASNYFDWMAQFAEYLITGHAYVDSQSADQCAPTAAPDRSRAPDSALPQPQRRREPRPLPPHAGRRIRRRRPHPAAKIDMASPNINLRDPAIYRIRHATHHNTGDQWCVYPMYLRPPHRGRAGKHHPFHLHPSNSRSAALLRLAARTNGRAACCSPLPQQIEFSAST